MATVDFWSCCFSAFSLLWPLFSVSSARCLFKNLAAEWCGLNPWTIISQQFNHLVCIALNLTQSIQNPLPKLICKKRSKHTRFEIQERHNVGSLRLRYYLSLVHAQLAVSCKVVQVHVHQSLFLACLKYSWSDLTYLISASNFQFLKEAKDNRRTQGLRFNENK